MKKNILWHICKYIILKSHEYQRQQDDTNQAYTMIKIVTYILKINSISTFYTGVYLFTASDFQQILDKKCHIIWILKNENNFLFTIFI